MLRSYPYRMSRFLLRAAVVVALLTGLFVAPSSATERKPEDLPPSACREAWLDPDSRLADRCRARGWVVWNRLVVTPRLVVTRYAIPACKSTYPDGELVKPIRPLPCYRGFGGSQDAKMFYATLDGTRHYVKKAR
jgi:hypothetical protein